MEKLEEKIVSTLTEAKGYWQLGGIIPPKEWCPDCISKLAKHVEEKYGHWTGKTLSRGKGEYTYANVELLTNEMRKVKMLQFDFISLPPILHICGKEPKIQKVENP